MVISEGQVCCNSKLSEGEFWKSLPPPPPALCLLCWNIFRFSMKVSVHLVCCCPGLGIREINRLYVATSSSRTE